MKKLQSIIINQSSLLDIAIENRNFAEKSFTKEVFNLSFERLFDNIAKLRKQLIKLKNILITGGAGFIGSNLALLLIECGYNIKIIDNLNKKIHGSDPKLNSETYNLLPL